MAVIFSALNIILSLIIPNSFYEISKMTIKENKKMKSSGDEMGEDKKFKYYNYII